MSTTPLRDPRSAAAALDTTGFATGVASLVLGIMGVAFLLLLFSPAAALCGLVGLPLGLYSRNRGKTGNGIALAGWILSLTAVLVPVLILAIALALLA